MLTLSNPQRHAIFVPAKFQRLSTAHTKNKVFHLHHSQRTLLIATTSPLHRSRSSSQQALTILQYITLLDKESLKTVSPSRDP